MALCFFVLASVFSLDVINQVAGATVTHKLNKVAASSDLGRWLKSIGLSELLPRLSAEGIFSPDQLVILQDNDITEFAKKHGLRLGDRATLRLGITTLRENLRTVQGESMAKTATDTTSGEKLQQVATDNEVALKGLAGCLASSGCHKEMDYCFSQPGCRSKAAAAASGAGSSFFTASPSRDEVFGAVAAMALPLSLAPHGAGLASCAMAQTEALAACMSASAPAASQHAKQAQQPIEINVVAV